MEKTVKIPLEEYNELLKLKELAQNEFKNAVRFRSGIYGGSSVSVYDITKENVTTDVVKVMTKFLQESEGEKQLLKEEIAFYEGQVENFNERGFFDKATSSLGKFSRFTTNF